MTQLEDKRSERGYRSFTFQVSRFTFALRAAVAETPFWMPVAMPAVTGSLDSAALRAGPRSKWQGSLSPKAK